MKKLDAAPIELLKEILAHLRTPDALSEHPWTAQKNALPPANHSTNKSPGEHLVEMLNEVFRKMMPLQPPRKGKRLDTRWGVFGILAAQYFAPLLRGNPFPSSLREAWGSIDDSIMFFVCGAEEPSEIERTKYRFAGNEPEPAPNSTLSDWHRKGLEQLAELVDAEQKRRNIGRESPPVHRRALKLAGITLGLIVLMLAAFLGWKAWTLYQHARAIETKANELVSYLTTRPDLKQVPEAARVVHELRMDLDAFQVEAEPYLWVAPYLNWIPEYGGTASQAEPILSLAQSLATAADEGLEAISPAVETALADNQPLDVMDLLLQLQTASPQLLNAQVSLAQAQEARDQIAVEDLTPGIQSLITNRIDPLLISISGTFPMEDALALIRIAPELLGGGKVGPQTYLILMQNEDELRPTGGFLTAAGSAVVKDGKLISINIESSDLVDDLSKPYPIPPWQFEEYMNIEMMLFRDSNWFTNFPTTASWAEYFYAYSRAASADGIITIDMHVIVRLLETLGPVRVDNVSYLINHENVLDYLRSAEKTPPEGVIGKWDRKKFIGNLAEPLLNKILEARGQTWTRLTPVLIELLDEKHILLQFDHAEFTAFIERRNWDGSVRIPKDSDYLMVVDTNMGYNKSNAAMKMALEYAVDLSTPANPSGFLSVQQINHSNADIPCEPFSTERFILEPTRPGTIPEPYYNIDECHWGYLRVYTPAGTRLTHSNPRAIPAESTMLGNRIPARTDDLGSEEIPGAQVFGMMIITPTRQSTTTEFEYTLPSDIVIKNDENNSWTYHLRVQKQPGMIAPSFKLILWLPAGASIENATIPFTENSGVWTAQLDLRRDAVIEVQFGLQ